jgi:sugar lactone lactonase YvrE
MEFVILQRHVFLFAFVLAAAMATGCSGSPMANAPLPASLSVRSARSEATASPFPNLYVLNIGCNSVTVYPPGQNQPIRTVKDGCPRGGFYAIAVGPEGNLFGISSNRIKVYVPGSSKVERVVKNGLSAPSTLIADRSGQLFVGDQGLQETVAFAPNRNKVVRTIGIWGSMMLDSRDDLYIDNAREIAVYSPGGKKLLYELPGTQYSPLLTALSSDDAVAAANYDANYIYTYQAHSTKRTRVITRGVEQPAALAYDAQGNLYCANQYNITVYPPHSTKPSEMLYMSDEGGPLSLAFDGNGNLYAADYTQVDVFTPGTTIASETITQGILFPKALTFGP